jgi:hypothetical protein
MKSPGPKVGMAPGFINEETFAWIGLVLAEEVCDLRS